MKNDRAGADPISGPRTSGAAQKSGGSATLHRGKVFFQSQTCMFGRLITFLNTGSGL